MRAIAFLVDFTLVAALLSAFEWWIPDSSGVFLQALISVGEIVFLVAYFVVGLARYETTVGKKLFKLRVVTDSTGEKISLKRAIVRSLALPFSFVMGAGVLMALFNPRRQAFHDMIAGTRVVRKS